MEREKLDDLSKILLATGAINYMANALHSVNNTMKIVIHQNPKEKEVFEAGIKHKDELLKRTVSTLGQLMEYLGECMNAHDCICEIDVRATKEAFNIIVHKNDDVSE